MLNTLIIISSLVGLIFFAREAIAGPRYTWSIRELLWVVTFLFGILLVSDLADVGWR